MSSLPRPILVDEADGPCEYCASWAQHKVSHTDEGKQVRHCDACRKPIPTMGHMAGHGFDSVLPHHYHLRGIGPSGVPGRAGVYQELCPDCYLAHRKLIYPDRDNEAMLDVTGEAAQRIGKKQK